MTKEEIQNEFLKFGMKKEWIFSLLCAASFALQSEQFKNSDCVGIVEALSDWKANHAKMLIGSVTNEEAEWLLLMMGE